LVAGVLILNLVLNLWTDLFSPFFVLAQKHVLASQSIRFNDLFQNKSSMLDFNEFKGLWLYAEKYFWRAKK